MSIITKPPAYRAQHQCLLGEGETKEAALLDAFGPKPWSKYQRDLARDSDCSEVTQDELE